MSIEEKLDQAKGSVKEVFVDAKDAVEGAIEGVKNVVKKDEE